MTVHATPPTAWHRKNLLGLEELSRQEIVSLLDTADSFTEISNRSRKKVPALQGRVVFNLFFENSTRTRTSFSLAAKRLSADTYDEAKGAVEALVEMFQHDQSEDAIVPDNLSQRPAALPALLAVNDRRVTR